MDFSWSAAKGRILCYVSVTGKVKLMKHWDFRKNERTNFIFAWKKKREKEILRKTFHYDLYAKTMESFIPEMEWASLIAYFETIIILSQS